LQVEDFGDSIAKKYVVASFDALLKPKPLEKLHHTGKGDVCLYQISEMLGRSRVETEDFLGRRHVPLSEINEAQLDREATVFEAGSHRTR
jgi:hypothetical protein